MRIEDKIQENEIKIMQALYEQGKQSDRKITSYDGGTHRLSEVIGRLGMSKQAAASAVKNLEEFEFVERCDDDIKLLPSGIKFCTGNMEHMH